MWIALNYAHTRFNIFLCTLNNVNTNVHCVCMLWCSCLYFVQINNITAVDYNTFNLFGFCCSLNYSGIFVRAGSNSAWSGGQEVNLTKKIIHEKFDRDYPYNLALLKTITPIKLNQKAKPIKLAKALPKAGSKATITGFGSPTVRFHTSIFISTGSLCMCIVSVFIVKHIWNTFQDMLTHCAVMKRKKKRLYD